MRMNPRARTPLPFNRPFTRGEVLASGHTVAALRGWRERHEVVELASGVFAPMAMADDVTLRRIWTDQAVAEGRRAVSVAGAAAIHKLWVPPRLHPSLSKARPLDTIPDAHRTRLGSLVLPDRAWTAVALGRGQQLEGALVAVDSAMRLSETRERLQASAAAMRRWPGAAALATAVNEADALSGSALESWSRGLMIRHGLPAPTLQHPIEVAGRRMYPDFVWLEQRVIGEADGQEKYGTSGADIFAEKRRQADLQASGYVLYRWGWPEVRNDCTGWLRGLRRLIG